MENIASLPFLISFTLSSANVVGSSARPSGSKYWPPGYKSLPSPTPGSPLILKPSTSPIRTTWKPSTARIL
ncbi:hypothetical protein H5410_059025 [Solanum commersonii]|uniref:Secreted protein n=1 Tax=Solanum commersonii TaxID=4109 RepID=A0A9J5W183_SOLCO|nr:hypothetical protein H5410_059025 [Solanum commersonii]